MFFEDNMNFLKKLYKQYKDWRSKKKELENKKDRDPYIYK